ncbi:efflux RND transporter periplasmic adaptor subunit [Pseudomarimonas arenosa]|uniref:Efflux RND transporter periplasmic adaptor subunit n=1 Tax=Pseudomarimonas arenosa TaxID=2774145 RepID=A0AAW3ZME6_9GAMM|nr:efflux RND transporter periplasmic adaptor subunit [Pseudomarimonas arenosa]MBD8526344.1 efflux RND transporter periplasmic adaptor subunit [Pseudomarimonas arenosa]
MINNTEMTPRRFFRCLAVFGLLPIALLGGCGGAEQGAPEHQFPAPDVSVALPVQRDVTAWDEYQGRLIAVDRAEIRPRVTGYLASMHFSEGERVANNALLFRIDDREYRAARDAAAAELRSAEASVILAEQELQRADLLLQSKAVSEGERQRRKAEHDQALATRSAAKAQLARAQLTLEFTEIRAPFSGRISAAMIKPGNLVNADQTVLTTLLAEDPIEVEFSGDEQTFLRYSQQVRQGDRPSARETHYEVQVGLSNEQGFPHRGQIVFVDNALDPSTGTIRARARLDNAAGLFTPGLFARVRLMGETRKNALLVHPQAILTDQDRRYVFVVNEQDQAIRHDLQLGPEVDGLRAVDQGLQPGDRVIVNGTRKVFFPGQPVKPNAVEMSQPNAQVLDAEQASAQAQG